MEFTPFVVIVLMIAFWWSGFVRAGLGFGGAGLMYPVALLAVDSVLFLVPIICVQLLVFSSLTLIKEHKQINWRFFFTLMAVVMPPFMVGVFGLISFSEKVVLLVVYAVIITYSLTYIFNIHVQPRRWIDGPALLLGGYVSGLSLAGAPVIAGVAMRYLRKQEIRSTLFLVWFILCAIKLATLFSVGVDLQLRHQVWLLPAATLGHLMGMRIHDRLIALPSQKVFFWLGIGLFSMSVTGLMQDFVFD